MSQQDANSLETGADAKSVLPRSVLIAEDEHLVATNLAQHLATLGVAVVGPATNGDQAVELAEQQHPDLALVDIRMPSTDGLTVASQLLGQMGIPVIIVSAYSDDGYVEKSAAIGVFGYMLKPVTLDELRVGLTVAWAKYRQHSDLRGEVDELKTALENRKIIERATRAWS